MFIADNNSISLFFFVDSLNVRASVRVCVCVCFSFFFWDYLSLLIFSFFQQCALTFNAQSLQMFKLLRTELIGDADVFNEIGKIDQNLMKKYSL